LNPQDYLVTSMDAQALAKGSRKRSHTVDSGGIQEEPIPEDPTVACGANSVMEAERPYLLGEKPTMMLIVTLRPGKSCRRSLLPTT